MDKYEFINESIEIKVDFKILTKLFLWLQALSLIRSHNLLYVILTGAGKHISLHSCHCLASTKTDKYPIAAASLVWDRFEPTTWRFLAQRPNHWKIGVPMIYTFGSDGLNTFNLVFRTSKTGSCAVMQKRQCTAGTKLSSSCYQTWGTYFYSLEAIYHKQRKG